MHPDAERLVALLGLVPHPEGGYYRETYRASRTVDASGSDGKPKTRNAQTAIYFLLPVGTFSAFHRVSADEVWHHYAGDPVDLHLISDEGAYSVVCLGDDFEAGERPQHVVPAGVWQAAIPREASGRVHDGQAPRQFALCGCTVAPGFDFADFEMPPRSVLTARFPHEEARITKLTRA